jgi:hypothetical protein
MIFLNSIDRFNKAIQHKALVTDKANYFYAGNFMYMHSSPKGLDIFKRIDDRRYITIEYRTENKELYSTIFGGCLTDAYDDVMADIEKINPPHFRLKSGVK